VIPPIHKAGYPFIAVFVIVTVALFWLNVHLGWVGLALTVWCCFFFRDPERVPPPNPQAITSPADGIVCMVGPATPPEGLGLDQNEELDRICVFMNVFDCHVNRAPMAGEIKAEVYTKGRFVNAALDSASTENERNAILIENDKGQKMAVVQIAGLVARRILSWRHKGDTLDRTERFGLIRFGSRVDVYLPKGSTTLVSLGQKAIAGETALASLPE
jgi:phosphatidylserine decarboxylase